MSAARSLILRERLQADIRALRIHAELGSIGLLYLTPLATLRGIVPLLGTLPSSVKVEFRVEIRREDVTKGRRAEVSLQR